MINSFYQSLLWCLKWEKKRSANLNGPFCKIMKFLYMVVLQAINPNIATYRAAAPKMEKPISYSFGLVLMAPLTFIPNFIKIGWKTKKLWRGSPLLTLSGRQIRKWQCPKVPTFKYNSFKPFFKCHSNTPGYFLTYHTHIIKIL